MEDKMMDVVRRHTAGCWIVAVVAAFVLGYVLLALLLGAFGIESRELAISVSSVFAICLYLALALWGLRRL